MIRLTKLADYGVMLMSHVAAAPEALHSASSLSRAAGVPIATVSKILKQLARKGLLVSHRGAKGGYSLARRPEELSVAEMITALDGPLALTQCGLGPAVCDLERSCAVKSPWLVINRVVHDALASVTLADLTDPRFATGHTPLAAGLARLAAGERI